MNIALIVLFSIQACVFLIFILLAFRWLLALRADAVSRSGMTFPGFGATLEAFQSGLADARYAGQRLGIAGCTIILLASAMLAPLLM
ncbi:MAG: hypothetical protein ABS76_07845 [Pelagibacterium sp. SCN 64-44]|nr:MAG: hypothetical protein ABS76_07845 [Pelagibacterium sp. SCN 64-44]